MNQYIAEILKCRIENMSFADKVAGLVMPVKADINGTEKFYPVAANSKHNDCLSGQYNDLMPNSRYKSVMYFEDLGIEFGTRNGDIQEFRSRLKLVAWLNLSKIMDENCPDSGAICAVLETVNALSQKLQNYAPVLSLAVDINQVTRDKNIFSEYSYDEKYSQYLFYPYDFFAITITVRAKINYACLCDTNLPTGCYPAVPSIVKQICIDAESFDGTMINGDCIRLRDFADGKYYANVNGQWVEVEGGGTTDHSELDNLGFSESGHTGFEAEGAAAQALTAAKAYTDGGLTTKLNLNQSPKQTISTSPIFNNLTPGRVVIVGADKSLTDITGLLYDVVNSILSAPNILVDNGTALLPSIAFKTQPSTGLHLAATGRLGIVVAGAVRVNITSNQIRPVALGTAAIPMYSTNTDLNTGIFFPAADTIAASTGGVERGRFNSEGLSVTGNIKATGSVQVGNNTALASATNVGSFRYRETANNSYSEQCVRNGAASYIWKVLNTETW